MLIPAHSCSFLLILAHWKISNDIVNKKAFLFGANANKSMLRFFPQSVIFMRGESVLDNGGPHRANKKSRSNQDMHKDKMREFWRWLWLGHIPLIFTVKPRPLPVIHTPPLRQSLIGTMVGYCPWILAVQISYLYSYILDTINDRQ